MMFMKGDIIWRGRKHSEKTKRNISIKQKGKNGMKNINRR